MKMNGGDGTGIAVDRIGSGATGINPANNYIHFNGYNKEFYGYYQGSKVYEKHDNNGISIMLPADDTFNVSGSLIQFTPTEKVNVTGNIEASGNISGSSTSTGSFGRVDSAGRSYFTKGMTVGTYSESSTQLILARGALAAPAITFDGDTNTGIYQNTDNEIDISINGSNIVNMDTYNFNIQSAASLNVGINDAAKFQVSYTGHASGSLTSTGSFSRVEVAKTLVPKTDNASDLGSSTLRWSNLYVGDMELNNEGSEGNEVDGTTGKWTIQEGEHDLYLLNRKSGKKYKFKLEEVT
jgi:hypothetical protein